MSLNPFKKNPVALRNEASPRSARPWAAQVGALAPAVSWPCAFEQPLLVFAILARRQERQGPGEAFDQQLLGPMGFAPRSNVAGDLC